MPDMSINQTYSEIDRFFADKILLMRMLKVRLKWRGAAQPSVFAILERVKGVEPSSPAWKAGVIAVIGALVAREHENGTRVADVGTAVVP